MRGTGSGLKDTDLPRESVHVEPTRNGPEGVAKGAGEEEGPEDEDELVLEAEETSVSRASGPDVGMDNGVMEGDASTDEEEKEEEEEEEEEGLEEAVSVVCTDSAPTVAAAAVAADEASAIGCSEAMDSSV